MLLDRPGRLRYALFDPVTLGVLNCLWIEWQVSKRPKNYVINLCT